MTISKYFWDLDEQALKKTEKILRNTGHRDFPRRMVSFLSRCDNPGELFSIIPRAEFVEAWPRLRAHWAKRARKSDSRDWWETVYEQILEQDMLKQKKPKGAPPEFSRKFGGMVREARIGKGLSQKQTALAIGMKQPDISRIEEGGKNITMFTMVRLCRFLGIKKIDLDSL